MHKHEIGKNEMFNQTELTLLIDALDMADKSNKRAQNSRINPQFRQIHEQIKTEIAELTAKIKAMKPTK